MSVKVHEPVCEDSAQDLYFWFDHFLGDQLKDEWDLTVAATGAGAVIDAQTGGVYRLSAATNATGDSARIDWNNIRSLHVDNKVTMEVRTRLSSIADIHVSFALAFVSGGNDYIYFRYDTSFDARWRLRCRNGGISTTVDSGVAPDTDWHIFRIECFPTDEVHFYIDGVETANSPITTNIPDDAGDFLQPTLLAVTNTTALKYLDIDYCVVRQER